VPERAGLTGHRWLRHDACLAGNSRTPKRHNWAVHVDLVPGRHHSRTEVRVDAPLDPSVVTATHGWAFNDLVRFPSTLQSWLPCTSPGTRATIIDRRRPRLHDRRMKLRKTRVGDEYTTGSFRDGIEMIVVILTVIAAIWLAYGWALNQPGVPPGP